MAGELLLRRRDAVLHYWGIVRDRFTERFDLEAQRTLLPGPPLAGDRETSAFSVLVETVETVALQRGLPRWAG